MREVQGKEAQSQGCGVPEWAGAYFLIQTTPNKSAHSFLLSNTKNSTRLCFLFSDIGERRQMLGSVSAKERSTPGLTSWGRKSPTLDRAMENARSCAKLTSSMSQLSTSGKAPYLDTLVVGIALLGLCWSRCGLSPINLLLTMVGHQISEWNSEGAHPTLIPVEFHPSYQPGAISKVDNFLAKLCLNILLDICFTWNNNNFCLCFEVCCEGLDFLWKGGSLLVTPAML